MPKITGPDLQRLADAIAPFNTEDRRAAYREGRFPRAEAVKDLDKRYRFDLFYAAGSYRIGLPDDVTDAHIETALRGIVPSLSDRS